MAEKLKEFSGSNWNNIGSYSYVFSSNVASANSDPNSDTSCQHRGTIYFSVSGSVQTALLNLYISWDLLKKAQGVGEVDFGVYLTKPDDDIVGLATHSENANSADNEGSMQLCDDLDIKAHLNQIGEYMLEVRCDITSAWDIPIDEPVYYVSGATYESPSLLVTERFTKSVAEAIGGGELSNKQIGLSVAEGAGLGESYSTIGGGLEAVKFEKAGIQESLAAAVAVTKAEGAGLGETLTRTYGYRQHDVPGIPEVAGIVEYLTARWQSGNFTTERDILAPAEIWEELEKASTDWEST